MYNTTTLLPLSYRCHAILVYNNERSDNETGREVRMWGGVERSVHDVCFPLNDLKLTRNTLVPDTLSANISADCST